MTVMNLVGAINLALRQEMKKDKAVLVLGEDVGRDGGVFRVTEGLWREFGEKRVIDTPLAETGIIGVSIGLSLNGLKPVAEIQFDGFSLTTLDQLINHAGRFRNRSRGRYHVPLVLRIPYGGGIQGLEHHSESPETHFVHTPGLKVVVPSNPYDAKGLLLAAIRDPDPVIYFEPKRIYRAVKQEVPERDYTIPIGEASVVQEGGDVTLIAWGAMIKTTREAVALAKRYSVELIDLRTLSPLDIDTIIQSVKKTGRVVIAHEAPKTLGLGAEISALINEKALPNLEAPVVRVTGYDTVIPLAKLEKYYFPDATRIVKGLGQVMSF